MDYSTRDGVRRAKSVPVFEKASFRPESEPRMLDRPEGEAVGRPTSRRCFDGMIRALHVSTPVSVENRLLRECRSRWPRSAGVASQLGIELHPTAALAIASCKFQKPTRLPIAAAQGSSSYRGFSWRAMSHRD